MMITLSQGTPPKGALYVVYVRKDLESGLNDCNAQFAVWMGKSWFEYESKTQIPVELVAAWVGPMPPTCLKNAMAQGYILQPGFHSGGYVGDSGLSPGEVAAIIDTQYPESIKIPKKLQDLGGVFYGGQTVNVNTTCSDHEWVMMPPNILTGQSDHICSKCGAKQNG